MTFTSPMHEEEKATSALEIPVDQDGKATEFRPLSAAPPHMQAFHLAWLCLFCCFFSTFTVPPLLPVIRDDLDLTATDISRAGVASVSGTIFTRLAMGPACDLLGPRVASAMASLLTVPAVLAATFISSPSGFVVFRFLVGFSLANFVSNQYWMSSMFAPNVVGLANGVSAGWANVGSGAAQILMPLVYSLIVYIGIDSFAAWRAVFFVPAALQALVALAVLAYGQDLPHGNHWELVSTHEKPKKDVRKILREGMGNYRGWILGLTYGYCYGVELTMENIVAEYFFDRFELGIQAAGLVAACFGTANVVSRPSGGMISDALGRRFGMRGRLWGLWAVQSAGGMLCILLGRQSSLEASMAVMFVFALFVQAASGLTYGVVPFVSKRSLGVVSGMTGSGGPLGAVVTQTLLFSGSQYSKQTGISLMGIMILVCTLPITLIYFPQWGGMFCGPATTDDDDIEGKYHPLE